jgi:hypothetical protein
MADVTIASFHLIEVGAVRAVPGLTRIGLDRRAVRATSGLVFFRSLGAGNDREMALSFRPDRRAAFAVWRDEAALDEFLDGSDVAHRWFAARSSWHVRLRLIEGHGSWGGGDPLADIEPAAPLGPVVTVTHASIAPRAIPAFTRRSRVVSRSLDDVPGLSAVVGIGELPIGRLGTVAVWSDDASVGRARESWPEHAEAMRLARERGWFVESLFARFAPFHSTGTWSGTDPAARCGEWRDDQG